MKIELIIWTILAFILFTLGRTHICFHYPEDIRLPKLSCPGDTTITSISGASWGIASSSCIHVFSATLCNTLIIPDIENKCLGNKSCVVDLNYANNSCRSILNNHFYVQFNCGARNLSNKNISYQLRVLSLTNFYHYFLIAKFV